MWMDYKQGLQRKSMCDRRISDPRKRPAYSVLSKDKIQKALGINLPYWKESLAVFLKSKMFDAEMIK